MGRLSQSRGALLVLLIATFMVLCYFLLTIDTIPTTIHHRKSNELSSAGQPNARMEGVVSSAAFHPGVQSNPDDKQHKERSIAPDARVKSVNCQRIFNRDADETVRAMKLQETYQRTPLDFNSTADCYHFRKTRGYVETAGSEEEAEFSLAFTIIMYKDPEQTERLLRAIYRPQNYYCIHVDGKSPTYVQEAMKVLASCFPNVILASHPIKVSWGAFSNLECDLICMKDLMKFKRWRYLINLTGQEFPLKTNLELVRILKTYNGANDISGTIKRRSSARTRYVFRNGTKTNILKGPPPKNMILTKGSLKVVMSRGFVDFVFNSRLGQEFTDWVKDTSHPDETFFTSLNHNPQLGVPGAFIGDPDSKGWFGRYVVWNGEAPCAGKFARGVCILSLGDLHRLRDAPQLFCNKFHYTYHPLALDCLEELHYERTRQDILEGSTSRLNMSVYEHMPFVKNHVGVSNKYPIWTINQENQTYVEHDPISQINTTVGAL